MTTPIYDQTLTDWSLRPDPPTRPLGAVHTPPRLDTVCPFCGAVLESLRTSPCTCPRELAGAGRATVAAWQAMHRLLKPTTGAAATAALPASFMYPRPTRRSTP